jgi:tellurite resistance protein TehA-like permease
MKKIIKNLSHYGDILAIPFFLLLSIYFYNIENKNLLEYILYIFCICGFILDILYTYIFLYKKI